MAFLSSFADSAGSALGNAVGSLIPTSTTTNTTASGTSKSTASQQKVLSQQAIDKLVYDVLSSDAGLASLATGENLSGGYAASTKALLAQDFVTKLVGELATVTAPTVQTQDTMQESKSTSKSKKKASVICTELNRQGLLSDELYKHPAALAHFNDLHPATLRGYRSWADPIIPLMQRSPRLSRALLPIARSRYIQVTTGKTTVGGVLTIGIGQPICFIIGMILNSIDAAKGQKHVAS